MALQKKNIALLILLVLVVLGSLYGYLRYKHSIMYVKTEDAYIKGDIYQVSFKTSGKVKEVYIDDNVEVKKGDLIATLEPEDYDLNVKTAENKYNEALTSVETSKAQIEQAKANIKTIESQLELAQIERKRAEALFAKESIPKQKYDNAVTQEKVLLSQLEAAKKGLETAVASLKTSEEKVKTSETAVENSKLVRSYCELYAPVSGVVTKKNIQIGQVVQAGQPICAIVPLETKTLYVEANYKETQLKRVKVGQKVKFWTDVDKSKVFEGEVESVSPGTGVVFSLFPPENATGNWVKIVQRVPVKIKIKPEQKGIEILRLGLTVTCVIDTTK
jgi:membrane fusion protein (multidrug efflux system)